MGDLDNLRLQCLSCRKCEPGTTRTNLVFGVGNPNARVMFIGEAPGEQEDLRGEPFVGRSGKLMDSMIAEVGLYRDKNIYIANMIKCRPPNNRDPLPSEQEACINWLRAQFKIIKPKIIVCVGRIAAARIMKPDIKITKEHGVFMEKKGVLMMATLHPAALLRNINQKPLAEEDFRILKQKIMEVCPETYNI
ncbi:MAG: uracil-DNA glycosylase [Oscillospiraceae bacterium]|nr:uracil-DNA glycosylase [Oscillospiraceae bacterium]